MLLSPSFHREPMVYSKNQCHQTQTLNPRPLGLLKEPMVQGRPLTGSLIF